MNQGQLRIALRNKRRSTLATRTLEYLESLFIDDVDVKNKLTGIQNDWHVSADHIRHEILSKVPDKLIHFFDVDGVTKSYPTVFELKVHENKVGLVLGNNPRKVTFTYDILTGELWYSKLSLNIGYSPWAEEMLDLLNTIAKPL